MLLPREVSEARTAPSDFVAKLKAFDGALVVYWNRFKNRWVIDRCIHGNACTHSGHCERINALVVQTPEGEYKPLGEHVLNDLRAKDTWHQFASADEWGRVQDAERDHQRRKIVAEIRGDWNSAIREDRVQLNRFRHLIQTHDLRRNK